METQNDLEFIKRDIRFIENYISTRLEIWSFQGKCLIILLVEAENHLATNLLPPNYFHNAKAREQKHSITVIPSSTIFSLSFC